MKESRLIDNPNEVYNSVGFLAELLIEMMDRLAETNRYRHRLKYTGNLFLKELESLNFEHRILYEKDKREGVDPRDVHHVVGLCYRALWELFSTKTAGELMFILDEIRKLDIDLDNLNLKFIPLEK